MKKTGLRCLILCIVLTFLPITVFGSQTGDDYAVSSGSHSIDATASLLGYQKLIDNCSSALLFEMDTQTMMYAWNVDEKIYPASFVKIMTAYIAIDRGTLNDIVVVTPDMMSTIASDAISTNFQVDEVFNLLDLIYMLQVDSSNDAATVIACHIGGTQQNFVKIMNEYAAEIGCVNTNYTNPHGFHNDNQYSTARDTARLLAVAMENETFRTIFATTHYTIPATNKSDARELSTGNFLMSKDTMSRYFDSRVVGSRTGVNIAGFRGIASVAEHKGLRFISIITGSVSEMSANGYYTEKYGGFDETIELLDLGFSGFNPVQLFYDDQILTQQTVLNGDCQVSLGTKETFSAILPVNTSSDVLTFKYSSTFADLEAPIEKGEKLSSVEVWYGSICIAKTDLYAMNKVSVIQQQNDTQIDDNEKEPWPVWLTVIVVVLLVVMFVFVTTWGVRMVRRATVNKRSRLHRKNRRRSR